jgi:hypothetical protein
MEFFKAEPRRKEMDATSKRELGTVLTNHFGQKVILKSYIIIIEKCG